MEYLYEAPTILETFKSNFPDGNNELAYKNFLLQRLHAIDPESREPILFKIKNIYMEESGEGYICEYIRRIKIWVDDDPNLSAVKGHYDMTCEYKAIHINSVDKLLEWTIGAQKNDITYDIQLEYLRDEGFKRFIQENYPELSKKIDLQVKNNRKSESFDMFYKFFINNHDFEPKCAGIITDKQACFYTALNKINETNMWRRNINHHRMLKKILEKINISEEVVDDDCIRITGFPGSEFKLYVPDKVTYAQYLFISELINAFEDAQKDTNTSENTMLDFYYATEAIRDDLQSIREKMDLIIKTEVIPIRLNNGEINNRKNT